MYQRYYFHLPIFHLYPINYSTQTMSKCSNYFTSFFPLRITFSFFFIVYLIEVIFVTLCMTHGTGSHLFRCKFSHYTYHQGPHYPLMQFTGPASLPLFLKRKFIIFEIYFLWLKKMKVLGMGSKVIQLLTFLVKKGPIISWFNS